MSSHRSDRLIRTQSLNKTVVVVFYDKNRGSLHLEIFYIKNLRNYKSSITLSLCKDNYVWYEGKGPKQSPSTYRHRPKST